MPLEGFLCSDGVKIPLGVCLERCRMTERCLTLPSLVSISQEREWKGVASTTMLLNGTMHEFLRITQPYYVDPDSRAFMLAGIKHHESLDTVAKKLGMVAEIPLSIDRDIFDLLEFEGKELTLTDYKLWGSFKVAKALGIVEAGKEPDPSGAVYKSSGKWGKAGSPKMVPVFKQVPEQADNWEAEYQLNRYRVMLKELGLTVHKMRLQVTVRDGGLYIARDRGVLRNIYQIPVKFLSDEVVQEFFKEKAARLEEALDIGEVGVGVCTPRESWDGIRCKSFCDVWSFCSKGQLVHGLEE